MVDEASLSRYEQRNSSCCGITVPLTTGKGNNSTSAYTSIAALATLNNIPLYTKDDHFHIIAKHTKLDLYSKNIN